MEQEIIDRAKWLYAYNGGYKTKADCVKQVIKEKPINNLASNLRLYDIELNEYIEDLTTKF